MEHHMKWATSSGGYITATSEDDAKALAAHYNMGNIIGDGKIVKQEKNTSIPTDWRI